jgi:guanylate kinase
MIYVLLGKTCSGKTTAFKRLIELGYEPIISYTTRPKRPDEVDGKDYHFITVKEFNELLDDGQIVLPREFNNWLYGIDISNLKNDDKNKIIILDPTGYRELKKIIDPNNITSFYLDIPLNVRLQRGLKRKDDLKELFRRLEADEKDFIGIENEVDYVINSLDEGIVLKSILDVINGVKQYEKA